MNLKLGDRYHETIIGTLDSGAPLITGTLSDIFPVLEGSLYSQALHDILLESGSAILYQGLDQRIDCALRTVFGEWWLDRTLGVPYFEELLKKNPDLSVARQIFASVILTVPGVQRITKLAVTFVPSTRVFQVTFEAVGTDSILASTTSEVSV